MAKLLTAEEFRRTFGSTMINITGREDEVSPTGVIDIVPYYQSIPDADFGSHQAYDDFMECVYRTDDDRFDHVLMMTRTENVYMAIVVDLLNDQIVGHHLLDLNAEYQVTATRKLPRRAGRPARLAWDK